MNFIKYIKFSIILYVIGFLLYIVISYINYDQANNFSKEDDKEGFSIRYQAKDTFNKEVAIIENLKLLGKFNNKNLTINAIKGFDNYDKKYIKLLLPNIVFNYDSNINLYMTAETAYLDYNLDYKISKIILKNHVEIISSDNLKINSNEISFHPQKSLIESKEETLLKKDNIRIFSKSFLLENNIIELKEKPIIIFQSKNFNLIQ